MVSSTDGLDGYQPDGLELVAGSGIVDAPSPASTSTPEVRTIVLNEPTTPADTAAPDGSHPPALPHEDVYRGDGDEIDLLEAVEPEPVYQPALIDSDDDGMMVIDQPEIDAAPDVIEVEDTLMAVDDYGDAL